MKVLVASELPVEIYSPLLTEADIDFSGPLASSDLEKTIQDYEGIIVRSKPQIKGPLLTKAANLKIIVRAGTGVDSIDVDQATKQGIVVENTPVNSISAAEHTGSLISALAHNIVPANNSLKAQKWEKNKFVSTELYGKTLGIIGMGRIGNLVAERAKAMGMDIVFYDAYMSATKTTPYKRLPLDDLLKTSDIVTLHASFSSESDRNMIGAKQFALMKKTAFFINAARGELVDENALYDALKNERLAKAGIDVFDPEPYTGKLLSLDDTKIIVTPHLAGQSFESEENGARAATKQMIDFLREGRIINAVNVSPFSENIRPYLGLIEAMGRFVGGLIDGPINRVNVQCYGDLCGYQEGTGISALVGLLSERNPLVSIVNANSFAAQNGIKVEETRSSDTIDYKSLVSLDVESNGKTRINVQGRLSEDRGPKIVRINGYQVEIPPTGHLLVIMHKNLPNTINPATAIIGSRNYNINWSSVIPDEKSDNALGIFCTDKPVTKDIVEIISKYANIGSIRQISLPELRQWL
jgi:D-3-phosphoglycerate dehydrogenase / 2-oxoglutarate reductase